MKTMTKAIMAIFVTTAIVSITGTVVLKKQSEDLIEKQLSDPASKVDSFGEISCDFGLNPTCRVKDIEFTLEASGNVGMMKTGMQNVKSKITADRVVVTNIMGYRYIKNTPYVTEGGVIDSIITLHNLKVDDHNVMWNQDIKTMLNQKYGKNTTGIIESKINIPTNVEIKIKENNIANMIKESVEVRIFNDVVAVLAGAHVNFEVNEEATDLVQADQLVIEKVFMGMEFPNGSLSQGIYEGYEARYDELKSKPSDIKKMHSVFGQDSIEKLTKEQVLATVSAFYDHSAKSMVRMNNGFQKGVKEGLKKIILGQSDSVTINIVNKSDLTIKQGMEQIMPLLVTGNIPEVLKHVEATVK